MSVITNFIGRHFSVYRYVISYHLIILGLILEFARTIIEHSSYRWRCEIFPSCDTKGAIGNISNALSQSFILRPNHVSNNVTGLMIPSDDTFSDYISAPIFLLTSWNARASLKLDNITFEVRTLVHVPIKPP